jgi:hypothetical protein
LLGRDDRWSGMIYSVAFIGLVSRDAIELDMIQAR